MYQNGMTCLATLELAIVEVMPEQLRIHEMCSINERDVRARYRAVVEPLLRGWSVCTCLKRWIRLP